MQQGNHWIRVYVDEFPLVIFDFYQTIVSNNFFSVSLAKFDDYPVKVIKMSSINMLFTLPLQHLSIA